MKKKPVRLAMEITGPARTTRVEWEWRGKKLRMGAKTKRNTALAAKEGGND